MNDLNKEVSLFQKEFADNLQLDDPFLVFTEKPKNGLLSLINDYNTEVIENLLGENGLKLIDFSKAVDLEHPHIATVFDGILNENSDITIKISELLYLFLYAKANNLNEALRVISKLTIKEFNGVFKDINTPLKNHQYIRLLKTREDRNNVRKEKKVLGIELKSLVKKGEGSWTSIPKSFRFYLKNGIGIKEEIAKIEKMAQKYKELRCNTLYLEVKKSIDIYNEQINDAYYGFQRVKMFEAALILAKVHGFEFFESKYTLSGSYSNGISIPTDYFGGYNFGDVEKPQFYKYSARVYPSHELDLPINDIIDKLECFPECNNKSIFDHYMVVVPSVNHIFSHEDVGFGTVFYYKDMEGNKVSGTTIEEVQKKLDIMLIENGFIKPILLAEKDGKCYFISYCEKP